MSINPARPAPRVLDRDLDSNYDEANVAATRPARLDLHKRGGLSGSLTAWRLKSGSTKRNHLLSYQLGDMTGAFEPNGAAFNSLVLLNKCR